MLLTRSLTGWQNLQLRAKAFQPRIVVSPKVGIKVLPDSGTPYVELLGVDQNLVQNQVKISRRQEVVLPVG